MTNILPLAERVLVAASMCQRVMAHLDLWWLTAGEDGRFAHQEVLEEYWEHIRFLEHGQLVTAVCELHNLLDGKKNTVNLPSLVKEMDPTGRKFSGARVHLGHVETAFDKIRRLRNNVFAHRTMKKAYNDVFIDAKISPDQLRSSGALCVSVCDELLASLGLDPIFVSDLPQKSYSDMLLKLRQPGTDREIFRKSIPF